MKGSKKLKKVVSLTKGWGGDVESRRSTDLVALAETLIENLLFQLNLKILNLLTQHL